MELYSSTVNYLLDLPLLQQWAEAREILERAAAMQPRDWNLPVLACQAVSGTGQQAIPASASLACTLIGVLFIDDMLDNDPRGEYHRLGEGETANIASAFLSIASQAILQSQVESPIKLQGIQSLNQMIMTLAFGQFLDLQNAQDEDAYWRVVKTKSSPFFGTALYLGALFGGASQSVAAGLERFGGLYGEMMQIHDDLNDTLSSPANPDWIQGRSPLPILFAELVEHPEQARFIELRREISKPGALREAQNILIRCGSISYCVDQLLRRHQAAQNVLSSIPLARRDILDRLLEDLVAPIQKLFASMGKSSSALSNLLTPS